MPLKKKKGPAKKKVIKKRAAPARAVKKAKKAHKKPPKKALVAKKLKESLIGVVTHYFPHVRAAVIKLKVPIAVGDVIKIKGHTTDLAQNVDSMQIDHVSVSLAKKGQEIGLLVKSRVRQHDKVYKG